jgi:hypothetical protein
MMSPFSNNQVQPISTYQVAVEGEVLGVALALPAEEVRRALADAAHVCAVPGTLQRVLDVLLKQKIILRWP